MAETKTKKPVLAPASPKQAMFLQSDAKIIIYGGSRGGGKTFCGLMRMLRWVGDPRFRGVVVRKQQTTLTKSGGSFDEAKSLYPLFDPKVKVNLKDRKFTFSTGAEISFTHLDKESDSENWRGLQYSAIMLDEATQFSEEQIWVMLSTLRVQVKGMKEPSMWLLCNPNPDSFIRKWIDWWLYPEGHEFAGRPDPDKTSVTKWFVRNQDGLMWGTSREDVIERYGNPDLDADHINQVKPISFQFLHATIFDNPPLIKSAPTYLSQLEALPRVKKERDLWG